MKSFHRGERTISSEISKTLLCTALVSTDLTVLLFTSVSASSKSIIPSRKSRVFLDTLSPVGGLLTPELAIDDRTKSGVLGSPGCLDPPLSFLWPD